MKIPVTLGVGGKKIGEMEIDDNELPQGVAYVFAPAFQVEQNTDGSLQLMQALLTDVGLVPDSEYRPIEQSVSLKL